VDKRPVFVDASGRRRLRLRWAGIGVGVVLSAYLIVVLTGATLGATIPYATWPTGKDHHPGGAAQSGSPHQVGGSGGPGASSPGTGTTPSPRLSGSRVPSVPGSTASAPSGPSASTAPTTATSGTSTAPTAAKTNGNSASAYGRTKTPNPHASGHG
jgi:hypothetical protein